MREKLNKKERKGKKKKEIDSKREKKREKERKREKDVEGQTKAHLGKGKQLKTIIHTKISESGSKAPCSTQCNILAAPSILCSHHLWN